MPISFTIPNAFAGKTSDTVGNIDADFQAIVTALSGKALATTDVTSAGQCRLSFISGTQIRVVPYNGPYLPVLTSSVWTARSIAAGVNSSNPTTASNFVNGTGSQALAANTTYLVTIFDNGGTLTFDFLTTLTHAADATTGVEIKNGDTSRTVVGMVRTNGSTNFQLDNSLLGVISWFNRRSLSQVNNFTTSRTTTSTTYIEVNTEIRCE